MTAKRKTEPLYHTNWTAQPVEGKRFEMESLTVPGQAYTIQELYEKSGIDFDLERDHYYLEGEEFNMVQEFFKPDFDLTDLDAVKTRVQEFQDRIEQAQIDALKRSEKEGKISIEIEPEEGHSEPDSEAEKES